MADWEGMPTHLQQPPHLPHLAGISSLPCQPLQAVEDNSSHREGTPERRTGSVSLLPCRMGGCRLEASTYTHHNSGKSIWNHGSELRKAWKAAPSCSEGTQAVSSR